MHVLHENHPFRIFWFSILVTIALGWVVVAYGSLADLWLYSILVILEVTFSFDNAVINSKVLARMSRVWQIIFLTVGIFIAVFVVRFALPIIIVMFAGNASFMQVVDLALNNPDEYSDLLHDSAGVINAFGGAFLLMLAISYFFDRTKKTHWIPLLERPMARAGHWRLIGPMLIILLTLVLYLTLAPEYRGTILVAAAGGMVLQIGLQLIARAFYRRQATAGLQVGWAAFASFMYLEVLDASFSFDGVVAAFAITSSVLLIVTGLGAGAIWVRSMTIYLLRSGTLQKYRYLEHGAHWAILALGCVMILKLYGIEPPEWIVGSIGLVFISAAVISSIRASRKTITVHKSSAR